MGRVILLGVIYAAVVLLIVMLVGCLDVYLHTASGRSPPPLWPLIIKESECSKQF